MRILERRDYEREEITEDKLMARKNKDKDNKSTKPPKKRER
jgi:hypothetical protein